MRGYSRERFEARLRLFAIDGAHRVFGVSCMPLQMHSAPSRSCDGKSGFAVMYAALSFETCVVEVDMDCYSRDLIAMICLNRTMDGEILPPQESQSHSICAAPCRKKKRTNRSRAWMGAFLVLGTVFSLDARADYWFKVNDASQIQFLIGNPQIYLRNLNSFDSSVQGTAPWTDYNYWIDSTPMEARQIGPRC